MLSIEIEMTLAQIVIKFGSGGSETAIYNVSIGVFFVFAAIFVLSLLFAFVEALRGKSQNLSDAFLAYLITAIIILVSLYWLLSSISSYLLSSISSYLGSHVFSDMSIGSFAILWCTGTAMLILVSILMLKRKTRSQKQKLTSDLSDEMQERLTKNKTEVTGTDVDEKEYQSLIKEYKEADAGRKWEIYSLFIKRGWGKPY